MDFINPWFTLQVYHSISIYKSIILFSHPPYINRLANLIVLTIVFHVGLSLRYSTKNTCTDDRPRRLGAIRFLIFRFRPNVWWFGLVLLARGPLLVLPGVVATNTPSLRLTLMNMILQTSLVLQVWFLPWKAPILNLVDALSVSLLVMLVNVTLGYADNTGIFAKEVLESLGTATCTLSYSGLFL